MKVAVLVVSQNRPDLVRSLAGYLDRNAGVDHDLYVVEADTPDQQLCEHSTVRFSTQEGRGCAYGFNVALEEARRAARESGQSYDFYWVLTSDLVFTEGQDALKSMVGTMEEQRDLGILASVHRDDVSAGSAGQGGRGWSPVTDCAPYGFLIRSEVIETVGFLNPQFRHLEGAITELGFLMYSRGWTMARTESVQFYHHGCRGPVAIQVGSRTDSAATAQDGDAAAKRFAYTYFDQVYGPGWTDVFMAAASGSTHGASIAVNGYKRDKAAWALALTPEERAKIHRPVEAAPAAQPTSDEGIKAVFAWPNYANAQELRDFFVQFGSVLAGRSDVGLFLRVDPAIDGGSEEVVAALTEAHREVLGEETLLQIELLEGELSTEALATIGRHFEACIYLEGEGAKWRQLSATGAPAVLTSQELQSRVGPGESQPSASPVGAAVVETDATEINTPMAPSDSNQDLSDGLIIPQGVQVDPALARKVAELQPWLYPVTIQGVTVLPGIGSGHEAEDLAVETARRANSLVVDTVQQVDFQGKSVLDLGSNCGFWSSHYADVGAARVLGVEARSRYVEQANLYWQQNQFMPEGSYEFHHGSLEEPECWERIHEVGPHSITVCTGILEHVRDYRTLLRRASEVTAETLILEVPEGVLPSGGPFGAVHGAGATALPSRTDLMQALEEIGFRPTASIGQSVVVATRVNAMPSVETGTFVGATA